MKVHELIELLKRHKMDDEVKISTWDGATFRDHDIEEVHLINGKTEVGIVNASGTHTKA